MKKNDSPSWAKIREAKGLSAEERLFLLTVNGHQNHIMFASRDTAMIWMGFGSKDRFYKTRKSLETKGLLDINERPGTTTEYRINLDVLGAWPKDERLIKSLPAPEAPVPETGTPASTRTGNQDTTCTGNQDGGRTGNKDHKSNYKSEPIRVTNEPVPGGPVSLDGNSHLEGKETFSNNQIEEPSLDDRKPKAVPGHEDCNHGRAQKWIDECDANRAFASDGFEW